MITQGNNNSNTRSQGDTNNDNTQEVVTKDKPRRLIEDRNSNNSIRPLLLTTLEELVIRLATPYYSEDMREEFIYESSYNN